MSRKSAAFLVSSVLLGGCSLSPSSLPTPYPEVEDGPSLHGQTYMHRAGMPDAAEIHHIFFAAYSRSRIKLLGGEDLETITINLIELRNRLGDNAFATALAKEHPAVISSVASHLGEEARNPRFPASAKLIAGSPRYKLELDQAATGF